MPNEESTLIKGSSGAIPGEPPNSAKRPSLLTTILHEPLLHFFALGALIFAAYAIVTPSVEKSRIIEVDSAVRKQITESFKTDFQREPTAEEMKQLVNTWILNEITYREALAQGLDRGDEMIRERIMQKLRLLVFDGLQVRDPSNEELTAWFEARRARYDTPDTVNFIALPFTGADAEQKAKSILQEIETGEEREDVRLRTQIFARRPRATLEPAFGKAFVDALVASPRGKWTMLQSTRGWYVVRLDSFVPGRKIALKDIYSQVFADWKDETRRQMGTAAIRDMGKAYIIRQDAP